MCPALRLRGAAANARWPPIERPPWIASTPAGSRPMCPGAPLGGHRPALTRRTALRASTHNAGLRQHSEALREPNAAEQRPLNSHYHLFMRCSQASETTCTSVGTHHTMREAPPPPTAAEYVLKRCNRSLQQARLTSPGQPRPPGALQLRIPPDYTPVRTYGMPSARPSPSAHGPPARRRPTPLPSRRCLRPSPRPGPRPPPPLLAPGQWRWPHGSLRMPSRRAGTPGSGRQPPIPRRSGMPSSISASPLGSSSPCTVPQACYQCGAPRRWPQRGTGARESWGHGRGGGARTAQRPPAAEAAPMLRRGEHGARGHQPRRGRLPPRRRGPPSP